MLWLPGQAVQLSSQAQGTLYQFSHLFSDLIPCALLALLCFPHPPAGLQALWQEDGGLSSHSSPDNRESVLDFGVSFLSLTGCTYYLLKIAGQEHKSPVKYLSDLKGSKAKHEY